MHTHSCRYSRIHTDTDTDTDTDTKIHTKKTKTIKKKKKKIKKTQTPLPPLHLDNIYSDFKVFMFYCSRSPIISHFFLNFLVFLESFKHVCFSLL